MKNLVYFLGLFALVAVGCNSNPKYKTNLAIAKKTFELFQAEDLETEMTLFSEDLVYTPPSYGAEDLSKEEFKGLLQMYHSVFDEIAYTPEVWLPGTDNEGNLDGSVRTYGTWNSKNARTGEQITPLRSYHFFNFNEQGEIIAQGDFFDATGLLTSIASNGFGPFEGQKIMLGSQKTVDIFNKIDKAWLERDYQTLESLLSEKLTWKSANGPSGVDAKSFIEWTKKDYQDIKADGKDWGWTTVYAFAVKPTSSIDPKPSNEYGEWVNAQFTGSDGNMYIDWYQIYKGKLINTYSAKAPN